jgi:hypothetical protein
MDGTNNTANNAANSNNNNNTANNNNWIDEIEDLYNDSIAMYIPETTHRFDRWVDDEIYDEIYEGTDNEFYNWDKYFIYDEIDYTDSYEDEIYNSESYNEIYNSESYNEIIYNIFDNNTANNAANNTTNNTANNTANNTTNNNNYFVDLLHEIENNHPESFAILGIVNLQDIINNIRAETNDPIEIRRRVEIFIHYYEEDDEEDDEDDDNDEDNIINDIINEIEINHPPAFEEFGFQFFEEFINNIRAITNDPIEIRTRLENFINGVDNGQGLAPWEEEWYQSENYPDFEINDYTLVIRNIATQIAVPIINRRDGYKVVNLNGQMIYYHRFIADAFVHNPDPNIYTKVDHIDRNRNNNFPSNLQWVTPSINNLNKSRIRGYDSVFIEDLPENAIQLTDYHNNQLYYNYYIVNDQVYIHTNPHYRRLNILRNGFVNIRIANGRYRKVRLVNLLINVQ